MSDPELLLSGTMPAHHITPETISACLLHDVVMLSLRAAHVLDVELHDLTTTLRAADETNDRLLQFLGAFIAEAHASADNLRRQQRGDN